MTDFKVFRLEFEDIEHIFIIHERENEDINISSMFQALDSPQLKPLAKSILKQIHFNAILVGIVFVLNGKNLTLEPIYGVKTGLSLEELEKIVFEEDSEITLEIIIDMYSTIDDVKTIEIYEVDKEDSSFH